MTPGAGSETFSRLQAALFKLDFGGRSVPVQYVRNPKARRYILRMGPGGFARVTIPRGGSLEQASLFAEKHRAWIEKHLAKAEAGRWVNGTLVLLRGVPTPLLIQDGLVSLGNFHFGPAQAELRPQIEQGLRMAAARELPELTLDWAARLGLKVPAARVRDQRTRWGSCSTRGVINLNWRLVQTPEFVRDYIIVHELMHLREMNHSPRFWRHVAEAFPRHEEAEKWLRQNSGLLR